LELAACWRTSYGVWGDAGFAGQQQHGGPQPKALRERVDRFQPSSNEGIVQGAAPCRGSEGG